MRPVDSVLGFLTIMLLSLLQNRVQSLRIGLRMSSNMGEIAAATHAFSVAPMMEYTDAHQRKLIRLITKKSVLYTEMVTANALVRTDNQERFLEADFTKEDPLVLQLGGSDPKMMADATKIA